MRLPRVLVVLPSHGHGGCEYGALAVALFLEAQSGCDVTLAIPPVAETSFLCDLAAEHGLTAVPLATTFDQDDDGPRFETQRTVMRRLLEDHDPTLVFLPLPWPTRGCGLVHACAEASVASLVKFALVPETLYGPPPDLLWRWVEAAPSEGRLWFANSRHSAALLERHFGLPPKCVEHFPVGPIGLAHLLPAATTGRELDRAKARAALRAEFGFPRNAIVATTVGRLESQKGYETALAAAKAAGAAQPDLHFLWIGEGNLRPTLEDGIAAAGLATQVRLAGFRRDVRGLLRGSDLFFFPTAYEGGSSQAVLEAMTEGLPVLASRTGAMADVVRPGVEGLLVPVGDAGACAAALTRLAADGALSQRLGAAGRRRARLFSPDAMIRQTLVRIDRLVASRLAEHPLLAHVPAPDAGFAARLAKIRRIFFAGR